MKKYKLLVNLPYCPKDRIFKEDCNGNYYHSMTDEEAVSGKFKAVNFDKNEITDKRFFKEILDDIPEKKEKEKLHKRIYKYIINQLETQPIGGTFGIAVILIAALLMIIFM